MVRIVDGIGADAKGLPRTPGQSTSDLDGSRRRRPGTADDATGSNAQAEDQEAFRELLARASRKTGRIPPEVLAHHVLDITRGADWPVLREAMDAILRRITFARRDGLVIAKRPAKRAALGLYDTRRRRSSARPYNTVIEAVNPPAGTCDCPDFLRSSLGLCKHLLVILEDLFAKPRRLTLALSEQERVKLIRGPRWLPIRPLLGVGDALERVAWNEDGAATPRNAARQKARRLFRRETHGTLVLRDVFPNDPRRRLRIVETLSAALKPPSGRQRDPGCVDPALRRLLEIERERLEPLAKGRAEPRRLQSALRTLKRTLYPYQREGVERFLTTGRLLLADDMGLGKTAQAIAAATVLSRLGKVRRGLFLVPASLKPQWIREWRLFSDVNVGLLDGPRESRESLYRRTRTGFLIGNYEQLFNDLELVKEWSPDLVVLDEAQRIKNWATRTAACVKSIECPYRLVLTGTPMENRLDELASILDWVDDLALEPKWRLVPWHTISVDGRRDIGGARNLETLRERLSTCMLRRVRQEVLDQLPARTDTRVPVEMSPEQWEVHSSLSQPVMAILGRANKRPLTQAEFLRLMQLLTTQRVVSNGVAQLEFESYWPEMEQVARPSDAYLQGLSSPKLIAFRDLIRSVVLEQGRKVVVFSQWRRMLKIAEWVIRSELAESRLRSVFFTGHEGQKRRTQNIVDFHDDPDVRVLFATDAGGVGLNLQRAANCCINLELPWNPAILEQRIGRIYRLGQERPIDVYHLVSETGIESRISDVVETKKALFTSVFDGSSDQVDFEKSASFLSQVREMVGPIDTAARSQQAEDGDSDGLELLEVEIEETIVDRSVDGLLDTADEELPDVHSRSADQPSKSTDAKTSQPGKTESPPAAAASTHPTDAHDVSRLLQRVEIRKKRDGSLVIEAPPEAASTLSALFEGMARLLGDAAR